MAQEIIVEIYSALETVEEINNFPAWVWSIARYTFYKWLGKQKKNGSIEIIGPIAHEEMVLLMNIINLYRKMSFYCLKILLNIPWIWIN